MARGANKSFIGGLKTLSAIAVDTDEEGEQTPPTVAAGSPEEAALLAQLEAQLAAVASDGAAVQSAPVAISHDVKLMSLRGRKYDVERAAAIAPQLQALVDGLESALKSGDAEVVQRNREQLVADLRAQKIINTGAKDAHGRAVIWLRLRFHDPKTCGADDLARLNAYVLLHMLRDAGVQRRGIVVIHDCTDVGWTNLEFGAFKAIVTTVLPRLPIRIAGVGVLRAPFFLSNVVLPLILRLVTVKLRKRIVVAKEVDQLDAILTP